MNVDFPLVTLKDAAFMLGIKHDTLRHSCQADHGRRADQQQLLARRLKAQKIGRDWFVDRAALGVELIRRQR